MTWREKLVDVGITLLLTLVSSGVLIRLFQPAVFDYIAYAFGRRSEVFKRQIELMFSREIAEQKRIFALSEANHDTLEFIRETVMMQATEIPRFSNVAERLTVAVETLTATCEKIQSDGEATRDIAIRLEERVDAIREQRATDFQRARQQGRRPERDSDAIDLGT